MFIYSHFDSFAPVAAMIHKTVFLFINYEYYIQYVTGKKNSPNLLGKYCWFPNEICLFPPQIRFFFCFNLEFCPYIDRICNPAHHLMHKGVQNLLYSVFWGK